MRKETAVSGPRGRTPEEGGYYTLSGEVKRVADLKYFRQISYFGVWLGLAPDDSPLLWRDTGTQDVYALDWKAP